MLVTQVGQFFSFQLNYIMNYTCDICQFGTSFCKSRQSQFVIKLLKHRTVKVPDLTDYTSSVGDVIGFSLAEAMTLVCFVTYSPEQRVMLLLSLYS